MTGFPNYPGGRIYDGYKIKFIQRQELDGIPVIRALLYPSHDYTSSTFVQTFRPVLIRDYSWIYADAFVGPGVTVGEGAVVGDRAVVVKDVEAWMIVAGNPAKYIKRREITS